MIGVRLKKSRGSWGFGMMEFTAIGTAIRISGRPMPPQPFTSDLSGQEFWQLRQAGYFPKGLVFGACSYYVHSDRVTRQLMNPSVWNFFFGQGRRNQEMVQLTQGFQNARELAMERMQVEAAHLQAEGIIGANIQEHQYSWSSHVIEFFAIGTAITPTRTDHHIPTPHLMLSLNDPPAPMQTIIAPPISH